MAEHAPPRLKFTTRSRIRQKRDFARLKEHGERLALGCVVTNWAPLKYGTTSRLGLVTSKRIGKAVVRNRARRLLREAFRLHQHEITCPVDLIVVARPSISGKGFAQVETDFLRSLERAGLLKRRGTSP